MLAICTRQDLNELVNAECEALTGAKAQPDGAAFCQRIDAIPDSAYIARGLHLIAQEPTLAELIESIQKLDLYADKFKIEVSRLRNSPPVSSRQIIVQIADSLRGFPNLDQPQHSFEVVVRQDGFYFGEVITRCKHTYRLHEHKPYHMSSSLPAQIARALVNLVPTPSGSILDPCCGTGSILLEAQALGRLAYGCDINPRMVGMSRKNLAHYGYTADIQLMDACECQQQADAVVTDLPYGHFQIMEESNIRSILGQCARLAPRGIFVAGKDVSDWLAEAGYTQVEVYQVRKKRNYNFTRFVHRAQSRIFSGANPSLFITDSIPDRNPGSL